MLREQDNEAAVYSMLIEKWLRTRLKSYTV